MLTTHEIRKKFLSYFASKGHSVLASDSLVPKDDPTVLFTTAGMQQFKKQFLGQIEGFTRAATSQKCLRTDDLLEVGQTAFHHTFFEMLGNFSFGDYFKKEAIFWAWEFLTKEMCLDPKNLWVSVYVDDSEAKDIWLNDIKIDPKKIVRLGDKSNFWPSEAKEKGPNGPCGPCSEIFFDYGEKIGCQRPDCDPDCSCGRFAEIWNLVFTQFDRKDNGILEPLPNKNIDTGMGLERLACVIQGKKTNFDIDLFLPILDSIDKNIFSVKKPDLPRDRYVLADHLRAIVFGINDGVVPSNEGRGYIMKKLIIAASDISIRHGNIKNPTIYKIVPAVINAMQEAYPQLEQKQEIITHYVKSFESSYIRLRQEKIKDLADEIQTLFNTYNHDQHHAELKAKASQILFTFRDTFGLTIETMKPVFMGVFSSWSDDDWLSIISSYESLMDQQREQSRLTSKMTGDVFKSDQLSVNAPKTIFQGYDILQTQSHVIGLFINNNEVHEATKDQRVSIVLDQTPFYAESGGQIGDTGWLKNNDVTVHIEQTIKISDVFIHQGVVEKGTLQQGDAIDAMVDQDRRLAIMRNHTATHLLQAALRQTLGSHVQQQGSLVAHDYLRFDFTHPKALTTDEIRSIEDNVNKAILSCREVRKNEMPLEQAQEQGALAFFAEKYHQTVRVIAVDDLSKELCGGTHLDNTGAVGLFKITHESAVAQGIRRLEAVTGEKSLAIVHDIEDTLKNISQVAKSPVSEIAERIQSQQQRIKQLENQLDAVQIEKIKQSLDQIIAQTKTIKTIKLLINLFDDMSAEMLKTVADLIKCKVKSIILVLGSIQKGNASIVVCVTDDLVAKGLRANEIIKDIAPIINGSGGGRPHMAQAGSKEIKNLSLALTQAEQIIKGKC